MLPRSVSIVYFNGAPLPLCASYSQRYTIRFSSRGVGAKSHLLAVSSMHPAFAFFLHYSAQLIAFRMLDNASCDTTLSAHPTHTILPPWQGLMKQALCYWRESVCVCVVVVKSFCRNETLVRHICVSSFNFNTNGNIVNVTCGTISRFPCRSRSRE